jgi:hypothetical protein
MTPFIRPAAASASFERPLGGGGKGAVFDPPPQALPKLRRNPKPLVTRPDRDHRAGTRQTAQAAFLALFMPKRLLFILPSMG